MDVKPPRCAKNPFGFCTAFKSTPDVCMYCRQRMDRPQLAGDRDGATFDSERDTVRLNAQMQRCYDALSDGEWHTPEDLERLTGDRWASLSARCRDLRKSRFGGYDVQRRSVGGGSFEYRLVLPEKAEVA